MNPLARLLLLALPLCAALLALTLTAASAGPLPNVDGTDNFVQNSMLSRGSDAHLIQQRPGAGIIGLAGAHEEGSAYA